MIWDNEREIDVAVDFRAKATLGVALAALLLLLPFSAVHLIQQNYPIGLGSLGIVFILGANAWMVKCGQCHQKLTLFGLVPAGMTFMAGVFLNDGIIGSLWCYPAVLACYCMLSERKAWFANFVVLAVALPMGWYTLEPVYMYRISATLIAVSMFSGILVHVIDDQRYKLQQQVQIDFLTGLRNRASLKTTLVKAISQNQAHGTAMALLAIDLDHFKQINDTLGHHAGDQVLYHLGALLLTKIRNVDCAFRTGGEEFLILLRGADEVAATIIAEHLRQTIEAEILLADRVITASIGVAELTAGDRWLDWVKRSDRRLYVAKEAGRNRVESGCVKTNRSRTTQRVAYPA